MYACPSFASIFIAIDWQTFNLIIQINFIIIVPYSNALMLHKSVTQVLVADASDYRVVHS
jgi:hypothetical protein